MVDFAFKANATVASLSDVPEFARPFYTAEAGDDGHTVMPEFAGMIEAYNSLNIALTASRKAERSIKRDKLDGWLALGENPDAVTEHIQGLEASLKDASKGKVNLDKMREDMHRATATAIEDKDKELGGMRKALERHMIRADAAVALAADKGDVDLLMPHVLAQASLVQDGDDFTVRIMDSAGDPRGDGKGGFMSISGLVAEMRGSPKFGKAFEADDRRGAGTGSNGGDPGHRPASRSGEDDRSPAQKITAGLDNLQRS